MIEKLTWIYLVSVLVNILAFLTRKSKARGIMTIVIVVFCPVLNTFMALLAIKDWVLYAIYGGKDGLEKHKKELQEKLRNAERD